MHNIVKTAFKAIAFTIIAIIVMELAFYIARVNMLNNRIESVLVTMQQDVTKNNYLSEDSYKMYAEMLKNIQKTMNGAEGDSDTSFIKKDGISLNYKPSPSIPTSKKLDYKKHTVVVGDTVEERDLSKVVNYGSVATIRLEVKVNRFLFFASGSKNTELEGKRSKMLLTYEYHVPCLRYIRNFGGE